MIYDALRDHVALDPPAEAKARKHLLARVEVGRAVALRRCGALKAAQVSAERAIDLSDDDPIRCSKAYDVLAAILSQRGRYGLAHDVAQRAVQLSASDREASGQAWMQLGSVLYRAERLEEARQAYVRARGFFEPATDQRELTYVEGNIGTCLMDMGKRKMAREQPVKAIQLARTHGVPSAEASWTAALGRLNLAEGKLDPAEDCAVAALRIARPRDQFLTVFRAEWLRYLVLLARKPGTRDGRRIAALKRLYLRVKENEGLAEVREFKQQVIERGIEQGAGS